MSKRTYDKQSDHDRSIENKAKEWADEGYSVEADLEGWNKPPIVDGNIPDIVAKKTGAMTRVCEIETDDTIETNEKKREILEKYANSIDASFWLYLAKEDGRCFFVR
ncbi:MAG: hypothetical protein ABIH76_04885 [Candidatus Bathyarchaeota archaeon]